MVLKIPPLVGNGIPSSTMVGLATSPTTACSLVLGLRGGADGQIVDLSRADLRLSSLESYAVVGSILLGAMIDVFSDTPKTTKSAEPNSKFERAAHLINATAICCGIMSAIYTTVVFTLFGLYAKTALGNGNDKGYLELLKATSVVRFRGFQSFLICIVSFNISVIMNTILNFQGITRYFMAALTIIGTAVSFSHFHFIVRTATETIFHHQYGA
jgi:hypothetical protein